MIAASCLALVPSLAAATDVEFTGRFGGTSFSSDATVETQSWYGFVGGSEFVAIDCSGPEMLWRLRPLVSYEYHWSGGRVRPRIKTQSDIVCLGVSRSFTLGYARTSVALAAAHFSDTYDVLVEGDNRADHAANAWGVSAGIDFRFKFLDHVDAVVGYKYLGREKPLWEAETSSGTPYSVEGRGGDHCISFGVSVILGGV
jgi:hypothetical protein